MKRSSYKNQGGKIMFKTTRIRYGLFIFFILLVTFAWTLKGCDREHSSPGSPANTQPIELEVLLPSPPNPQAKAVTYTITAMGLDAAGNDIGPKIGPIVIENPEFPLSVR
jgi:hypothetical protein